MSLTGVKLSKDVSVTEPTRSIAGALLTRTKKVLLGPYMSGKQFRTGSVTDQVTALTSFPVLINFGIILFLFWFVGHSFWIALLLAALIVGGQVAAGYFLK